MPEAGSTRSVDAGLDVEDAEEGDGDAPCGPAAAPIARTLVKRRGVYYLQSPEKVHKLLDVDRYSARWPLIPSEELQASSVEHPYHPEWRWLLHSRRVPLTRRVGTTRGHAALLPVAQATRQERSACAGVGDPAYAVWTCWDCLASLGAQQPRMPLNGLTNDNWIGREKVHVRDATPATKMLSSIARCCFKQVRLGKGIFFSQPTAEIPSMTLPPPDDALVDSCFNAVFTRSVHDLSKAQWATVKRDEYLRIVRERKKERASFA